MKPISLSLPAQDVKTADSIRSEKERVLHRALDEAYFQRELAAGTAVYEGGAVADALNGIETVMRFPAAAAGVNTHARRTVGMNALWARTKPRLTIWYTSPVGSTNTFTVRFTVRMLPVGIVIPTTIFFVDFTPAGPAAANTTLSATVLGSAVIPSVPAPLILRVGRLGGDANANALDVFLARVTFEEVA